MAVCGIVIASIRNVLGLLFISDRAVVSAIASIAPLAAIFQLVDGIMGTTAGALRGMGRQKELLIYNFTGTLSQRCSICTQYKQQCTAEYHCLPRTARVASTSAPLM
jgi:Na+-driven multidrug efflux pump